MPSINLAVHATYNAAAIKMDGQLKPQIETGIKGFGSAHRCEDDDQHYVFFGIGDVSYYIKRTDQSKKTFIFNLDQLLGQYKAIVRFENPTYAHELNELADTNFNVDGVSGAQARSMLTKIQRYKSNNLCTLEVMVKGPVDLSDVVSTEQAN